MCSPRDTSQDGTAHRTKREQRRLTIINGLAIEGPPPTVQVQRASHDNDDPFQDNSADTSDAKWSCCTCGTSNGIRIRPGDHPLGALACKCPHKPCGTCKTSGQVKPFLPMEEPAVVPITGSCKSIRFGVICPCCGLSWRAREVGKRYSKTLRKIPSLQLHASRLVPSEGRLRKSRSTLVLGNRRIVTPPGMEMPKQAEYATVKFSGVACTCGMEIDLSTAFCFQIVGVQVDEREKVFRGLWAEEGQKPGWSTTPVLLARGHGTPTLRIRGVFHDNPLRSCPVMESVVEEEGRKSMDNCAI